MTEYTLTKVDAAANRTHAVWRLPDGSEVTELMDRSLYTPDPTSKDHEKRNPITAWINTVATLTKDGEWVRTSDGAVFVLAGDYAQWDTVSGFLEAAQTGQLNGKWRVHVPQKGIWELTDAEAGADPSKDADVSGDGWTLKAGKLVVA